jgi:PAS domain S-box-containing protein
MTDIHTILQENLKTLTRPANLLQVTFIAVILIALYLISTVNYLLFHGIVEVAGIAVAFSIFIIIWNTRKVITDGFFLIIGISFLFFGSIDLVHMLAYKGMGIFPGNSSDLPTQLWIAARYFQSITFLIATLFIGRTITKDRKYDVAIIIGACTAACALLFASIFVWQNFPHCFIEGSGLTPFKIVSEYVISLILIATIVILYLKREHFDPTVWKFLIAAQLFLILGELAFTSYISVFGVMNMLGHLFRLISIYLFYRAFVVISLTRPYDLLLRELKINENTLRESENKLDAIIRGSPIPQFVIDSNHRVTHWNEALEKYSGIKAEDIIGTNQHWRAFYPHERPCMTDLLIDGAIEKIPELYEEKFAKSTLIEGAYEGTDFFPQMGQSGVWLYYTAALIRGIDGRIIGAMETLEDITGRKNAEMTVQKLLQFQNSALMNANVLLFVIDPNGIVKIWNKAAESITGYTAGEVVGSNTIWRRLYPEKEYRRLITSKILPIIKNNNFLENLETTVRCRNGDQKVVSWNTKAMTDEIGSLSGYIAIGLDITAHKRAEEALKESERRYRITLDAVNDGIWDWNIPTGNAFFSDHYYSLLGYSPKEFPATYASWRKYVHPEDLPSVEQLLQDHIRDGTGFAIDLRMKTKNGGWKWVSTRGTVIETTPSGEPLMMVGTLSDITERKQVEEEVRKARDFYLKILDDFPNPIWRADIHAKCDYFNKDWLSFTGRTLEQEIGDGWVEGVHKDDLDRCLKIFLDNFNARTPFEMEYRLRFHDGTYHWLNDSGKPFYNSTGEFSGYIGSCYDIQGRRQAEEALKQVNIKLNLLSSITRHDINNQLLSLMAYLELSKESLGDVAKTSEYIIKEERAANAIERQIIFTKEYQDLGVKAPVWQNVEASVKKVLTVLPMRDVRVFAEVNNLEVYADPLLEKVFYNLIDNALRYGGQKMTAISISSQESETGLIIFVQDDGGGIPADDKKRLFERGFGHHTGLGLFLSREILSITGITIAETGEPGKGARFEILVPTGGYRI